MRSGRLRHTASVYTKSATPDSYGAVDTTETLLGLYKCSLQQKYLQERAENGEVLSRVRFDLIFRYRPELASLSPDSEIDVDGRRLVVMTVADPTGKHHMVMMTAEERR